MQCVLLTPLAMLLGFKSLFNLLLVLKRVVVHALANCALQFYEIILRHNVLKIDTSKSTQCDRK